MGCTGCRNEDDCCMAGESDSCTCAIHKSAAVREELRIARNAIGKFCLNYRDWAPANKGNIHRCVVELQNAVLTLQAVEMAISVIDGE